ncbi:MAG: MFS transporter [Candidatus Lokiarchaeota archaeon]|nr:MFS transporter [Candidatus Lokiarchaeota archaeon]
MTIRATGENDERRTTARAASTARELVPFLAYVWINGATGYAFFAFAPDLINDYVNEGLVLFILMFQPVVIMFLSPVFGRLSDRFHSRKVPVVAGLAVQLASYALIQATISSGSASVASLVAVYVLRGLAIALASCESAWFSDFTFKLADKEAGTGNTGVSYYFTITSIAWATGVVSFGWLITLAGIENLGWLCMVTSGCALAPVLAIKDRYAEARHACAAAGAGAPARRFSFISDIKELDQGPLVYAAIGLRHFGLITALSIIAIVLDDMHLDAAMSGIIISLNPVVQIAGMALAAACIARLRVKPLHLYAAGLACSTIVVLCYALGEGMASAPLVAVGQAAIGIAWPFMIVGFEEYIIRNVDWYKRANYVSYREVFMNLGKVAGQFTYFVSFELLALSRQFIFTALVFFPLAGFMLSIVAIARHRVGAREREGGKPALTAGESN